MYFTLQQATDPETAQGRGTCGICGGEFEFGSVFAWLQEGCDEVCPKCLAWFE